MSDEIQRELMKGGVVDITTRGRRTGKERRIEIRLHVIDEDLYLTGAAGPRSWHANLRANPDFHLHLKREVLADLDARATEIVGDEERRRVHGRILKNIGKPQELELRVAGSPLMYVTVDPDSATN
jgi:deazaflavin-dependent oxidoreductase (nitroreductase family)